MEFREYITVCDRIEVVQTAHSFERALQRGWDEDNLLAFVQEVGYFITTNQDQVKAYGYNEEIFYWSPYFDCGLMATLRRDYKEKSKFIIAIITIYPKGSRNPLHPDTRRICIDKCYHGKTYDKWGYAL